MPAIQIARLKLQTGQLREMFSQPEIFLRSLRHIMEFYADRTRRPGQSGSPSPLIEAYNVPAPVIRQILLELKPLVIENPSEAVTLMDVLWDQDILEFKILAANLLGVLPADPSALVINRLLRWIESAEDRIIRSLLDQGLANLREYAPHRFLRLVQSWIESSDWREQQYGLLALLPLIKEERFEDLPLLFRFLTPLVRSSVPVLRPHVVSVVGALARRSPSETAYFLKQNLVFSDTPWLARQVLKEFPPAQQEGLRSALQTVARSR
jgi:hypothetical protein